MSRYINSKLNPKTHDWESIIAPHVAEVARQNEAKRVQDIANQQAVEKAAALDAQRQLEQAREVQPAQVSGSCSDWMAAAGITDTANAANIINRESGCNPNAVNAGSGACGIGQQLPCGKWSHAWNDPIGGMVDMQAYVMGRYGSWAAAWSHSQQYGWY